MEDCCVGTRRCLLRSHFFGSIEGPVPPMVVGAGRTDSGSCTGPIDKQRGQIR